MTSKFKVGDRVVATDRIDEEGEVLPGERGVIENYKGEGQIYPYQVRWDSGYRSSMIGKHEIEPEPVEFSQYVLKTDLEKLFDDWFSRFWRVPGSQFNTKLKEHGISFDPPKKRWRVSFEVESSEQPDSFELVVDGEEVTSTIKVEEI